MVPLQVILEYLPELQASEPGLSLSLAMPLPGLSLRLTTPPPWAES